MHYGSLAILLPITAWIALSSTLPRRIGTVAGIVLVLLFARAYWANYQWREFVVEADKIPNSIAQAAIMGREDPTVVAATYITRYFYIDTPHTRSVVAAGINILRVRCGAIRFFLADVSETRSALRGPVGTTILLDPVDRVLLSQMSGMDQAPFFSQGGIAKVLLAFLSPFPVSPAPPAFFNNQIMQLPLMGRAFVNLVGERRAH